MTSPLYLVDPAVLVGVEPGTLVSVDGVEAHHAVTVRRTRIGERIDLADGAGTVARCVVSDVSGGRLEVRAERVEREDVPVPELILVQALAKGGRDESAIETATEIGVDRIVPWQAERSIVQWSGERGRRASAKWVSVVRAAAKQSRRARIPVVEELVTTVQLGRAVAQACLDGDTVIVLDGGAERSLADFEPRAGSARIWLVVGPEGGIGEGELRALTSAGAVPMRLGSTVLRSSSAGPVALSLLCAALRWGSGPA